jgi:hypothetical protein
VSEEFDVGKIQRGAQRAYDLAPNPVFFMMLTRAVLGSLDELRAEWEELPEDVRKTHENWEANLVKYRARVLGEQIQAKKVVDFIASGDEDWQEGIRKGTAYANALHAFFLDGDSSKWANLANQLAEIKEWYVEETGGLPRWTRPTFFFAIYNPLLAIPAATTALSLEWAAQEVVPELEEFAEDTAEAAEDVFDDVVNFLKKAGIGIVVISGLALLLYVVLKARSS